MNDSIERVIMSNDSLIIYCSNENEDFELRFQGNDLYIEYTNRQILYEDEGYAENDLEEYSSLQEVQQAALNFILQNNATEYIEIRRNDRLLFSSEEYQNKINKAIRGLHKRELGLRFGNKSEIKYLKQFL